MTGKKIGKSGYLLKRGEINKSWRVRWFVLQEDKLYYFKSPEQTKAIAFIPLDQSVVRHSLDNTGKEYCFEIVTKQRVYQLVAKSHTGRISPVLYKIDFSKAEEMIAKETYDQYKREEARLQLDKIELPEKHVKPRQSVQLAESAASNDNTPVLKREKNETNGKAVSEELFNAEKSTDDSEGHSTSDDL